MTDLSAVDRAASWADLLVRREHCGPGDTLDAARHRTARKYRLPEQLLWALRYRRPKQIWADIYLAIEAAVATEIQSQEARLAHELAITKTLASTPARRALIAETEALLGSLAGEEVGSPAEPANANKEGK